MNDELKFKKLSEDSYDNLTEKQPSYFYKTEENLYLGEKQLNNQVNRVKGENETQFQTGDVIITKAGIGLDKVENIPIKDQAIEFESSETLEGIESGNTLATILGKIKTWFTKLKDIAFTADYDDLVNTPSIPSRTSDLINDSNFGTSSFSGNYDDLANKPTIPTTLPANGGNADTIDDFHASQSTTANTIVVRDENGVINTEYINSNSAPNENPIISQVITTDGQTGKYKKSSLSHLKSSLDLNKVENKSSAEIRDELTKDNIIDALTYEPLETESSGTLDIKQNNVSKGTFSADSKEDTEINIEVPTKLSDLEQDIETGRAKDIEATATVDNQVGTPFVTVTGSDKGENKHIFNFAFSNLKGDKGDTGDQGPQGLKGDAGSQGISAGFGTPTATINNNSGTPSVTISASGPDTAKVFNFNFKNLKGEKGDQGIQGLKGDKGDKGDAGAQGPQGLKGDTGSTGPQGPTGATGATPTIACSNGPYIGSVGTPSVSLTQSGNNYTFSFNYLKGATGATGPQGPQGNQGSQGAQGIQGPKGDKGDKGDTGATGPQGPAGTTTPTNLYLSGTAMVTIAQNNSYYNFRPVSSQAGNIFLGYSSFRWNKIYTTTAPDTNSDRRLKTDIQPIPENFEQFFMDLKPVIFKRTTDPFQKTCMGFIAQEVGDASIKNGIPLNTLDLLSTDTDPMADPDPNVTNYWGMAYGELHGLEIHMLQKLIKKVDQLEKEIQELKGLS